MSPVTPPVACQGEVGEQEVERGEATIQISVKVSESLVHTATDFFSLQGSCSCKNDNFRSDSHGIE